MGIRRRNINLMNFAHTCAHGTRSRYTCRNINTYKHLRLAQPRKPGSSPRGIADCYGEDPGWSWSRDPPDFGGSLINALFAS